MNSFKNIGFEHRLVAGLCFAAAVFFAASSDMAQSAEAADFTLPDPDGRMHSLSDFRGEWVVVNFWATWCSPCLAEIPDLIEVSQIIDPAPVTVIGIDFEEIETDRLKRFIETLNISYLILRIGESPLIPFEPLKGLPTTFIVSPEGEIVYTHVGATTKSQLIEELRVQIEAYSSQS